MVFKKYKVADNAMAKLALPLTETTKTISIKDAINIPEGWERIATLAKVVGNEVIKMEKVIVKRRTENVLQVERGFESNPLQRETNDLLCLNVTAEVIRDLQNAVAEIDVNNKESLSNKKAKIVWNHTSNLFYPTIKAVWDWVTGLLNKKADLVNGKVPASQLPEVSQIDERNLVHKSWDEVIDGKKTFKDAPSLVTDIGWDTNIILRMFHDVRWSKIRILFKRWSWTSENPRPANVWDVMGAINFEDAVEWKSYFGIEVRKWQGKGKAIISESDLDIWWKSPIDIHVNGQNRTGERKDYTPTVTPAQWQIWEFRISYGRYKQIGKTMFCAVYLDFKRGSGTGFVKISLPTTAKEHVETPIPIVVWWHGMHYKNSFARGAVKAWGYFYLLSGIVSGLNIQDIAPLSDGRIVVCGEFTYETE